MNTFTPSCNETISRSLSKDLLSRTGLLDFQGQGTGFPKLAICFLLLYAPGQQAICFLFLHGEHTAVSPWLHVLHMPHLCKMQLGRKRKAPLYSQQTAVSIFTSFLYTAHTVKSHVPFCVLTCNHSLKFFHLLESKFENFHLTLHWWTHTNKLTMARIPWMKLQTVYVGFAIVKVKP